MPTLTYQIVKGKPTIRLAYRTERGVTVISTKRQINPDHFNPEAKSENWVRPSYGNGAFEFNQFLKSFRNKHQAIIDAFWTKHGKWPTTAEFKDLSDPVKNDKSFFTLWDRWMKFQSTERGTDNVSQGTYTNYQKTRNRLEEFAAHQKKPMNLEMIDGNFYTLFLAYGATLNNSAETTSSYIKIIKNFLNWANNKHDAGIKQDVMKTLKVKDTEKFFIYLFENEFNTWCNLDLIKYPHLERARDNAVVQCSLGCRFSDLLPFVERIQKVGDKYTLRAQTQKNEADILTFEIFPSAVKILKKYEGMDASKWVYHGGRDNVIYNALIKEVAKLAGMYQKEMITTGTGNFRKAEAKYRWELVTTHTFRRTFINLCLAAGVRDATICSITGQSIRTIQRYKQPDRKEFERATFLWDRPAPKDGAEPQEPKQG